MVDFTDLTQIAFFANAAFILFTMFMALTVQKVMQATYWLILMLAGVGVTFLLANSEIMFAFQISIYGGGIAVLLLFAVLLTKHDERVFPETIGEFIRATWSQVLLFLVIAINLSLILIKTAQSGFYSDLSDLGDTSRTVYDENTGAFAVTKNYTRYLWADFGSVIPFLGLLFLAAMLGSIKLVIREWQIEDISPEMRKRYEGTEVEQ
ncbi:MAG: NADH-quinone oxidoreductase subunit J family protein [Candidatus Kariarchaeaceae archaeon]|jgi:NADH-quinone oxidoreductase subunit J